MSKLQETLAVLPETEGNVVSVLSGGLDSTIMTYLLVAKYGKERVFALSYNYNQKQSQELDRAAATCKHLGIQHKVLDLGILGSIAQNMSANIEGSSIEMPTIKQVLGSPQPPTYVPFRNMILNSLSFSFAESVGATYIFSGLQARDCYGYWDTTPEFVSSMNAVAAHNRMIKIQLVAPFNDLSKADEIMIAQELGNVKLEHTLSCYNPDVDGRSCGRCPTCAERIKAFMDCGIVDPIQYSVNIPWSK